MKNFKVKSIFLAIVFFNCFFTTIARANTEAERIESDRASLEAKSNILLGESSKSNRGERYLNRANLLVVNGKWDLALVDYNKAIQVDPNLAIAYSNRGFVYYNQNKWNLALADYNKAIQIDPNLAEPYNNRGLLYYKQKKWDLALADFNKSTQIQSNPNLSLTYSNRGFVYYNQKKWDLALADFNKSIEINPDLAEVYILRSLVWIELGNKSRSIEDLKTAAEIFQQQNNLAGYQGVTYMLKKLS